MIFYGYLQTPLLKSCVSILHQPQFKSASILQTIKTKRLHKTIDILQIFGSIKQAFATTKNYFTQQTHWEWQNVKQTFQQIHRTSIKKVNLLANINYYISCNAMVTQDFQLLQKIIANKKLQHIQCFSSFALKLQFHFQKQLLHLNKPFFTSIDVGVRGGRCLTSSTKGMQQDSVQLAMEGFKMSILECLSSLKFLQHH